nr:5-oxoprolinase subunit PxpA [Desmospora profundinema]
MRYHVDLNSDLGESFGRYVLGQDEAILRHVTSANIACGYHAGDHNVMRRTVALAARHGVGVGAHPGLPDLLGFGRRYIAVEPEDVYNMVIYQVGALAAFAKAQGIPVQHVKPHGALFHMASKEEAVAQAIAEAVRAVDPNLILFGLAKSALIRAGREAGLRVAEEVFADRTYQPDGTLTPRTLPDAYVTDPAQVVDRVIRMVKEGKVRAVDGTDLEIRADTVCIHGDDPQALPFVTRLRERLTEADIGIQRVGVR